jgi:hypothetical protein
MLIPVKGKINLLIFPLLVLIGISESLRHEPLFYKYPGESAILLIASLGCGLGFACGILPVETEEED